MKNMNRFLVSASLLVSSCWFQGPWDYTTSGVEPFRGIEANATLVADQKVRQICFERMMGLDEEYTPAYAWYQKADVKITGQWSNGQQLTLNLVPNSNKPSCFETVGGDELIFPAKGETYQLSAVFEWDSAGTDVKTNLSASATIPKDFGLIHQNGALAIASASRVAVDKPFFTYSDGDTVRYLINEENTLSHKFITRYDSATVAGVLITQRLDTTANIPANRFSEIAARFNGGVVPASSLSYDGSIRQLLDYSNQSLNGSKVLDSISFPNTYFFGGRNRLYFYAHDSNYTNYVNTYVGGQDDPKIRPRFNIRGGWGFFAGMVVDSIDVHVEIPSKIQQYSFFEAFAAGCGPGRQQGVETPGWDKASCRLFERRYCEVVNYDEDKYAAETKLLGQAKGWEGYSTCQKEVVQASLQQGLAWDALALQLGLAAPKDKDRIKGEMLYCLDRNFKPSLCQASLDSVLNRTKTSLNEMAWNYCLDRQWRDSTGLCPRIMVSYVRIGASQSPLLKQQSATYCKNTPSDPFCGL